MVSWGLRYRERERLFQEIRLGTLVPAPGAGRSTVHASI
jgi:hypothetical protein